MPGDSRWVNRICRLYAIMLRVYPKAFRIQFGPEVEQVFRDSCRAAVINKHLFRFVLLMFSDWLWTCFRERLAPFGSLEAHMKGWWLLVLCGILDAMCAATHLFMLNMILNPYGPLGLRRFALPATVWDMSIVALLAGTCAVAAGVWNAGRSSSWLLSLHGLALAAFGSIGISPLVRGPLGFRPISLLFVLMALSLGAFALRIAQISRSGATDRWLLSACAAASVGYALSFVAVGFGWVRIASPYFYWIWMSSYFTFTSLCMLKLAERRHEAGPSQAAAPITRT
ncbi:MAG: hypothetical protein JO307_31885 [Bryobacterales bacterium]|nr:hypothetical protein [Bryobacterales bacterium]MBV9400671.1 hypothetical protein [Bryobacterales bacterium]